MSPITSEREWLDALQAAPRWRPEMRRAIVVAPHPDDEVLGAGGVIAEVHRRGVPILVLGVTDGEAAYGGVSGLGSIRRLERERALGILGLSADSIVRLRLPDGGVSSHEERLVECLGDLLTPDTTLVAPWEFDSHPDHEACGRAAVRAARSAGSPLIMYFFWAWHRQRPEALMQLHPRRFELEAELLAVKLSALAEYRSQLEWETGEPSLPDLLLAPARRSFETFVIS